MGWDIKDLDLLFFGDLPVDQTDIRVQFHPVGSGVGGQQRGLSPGDAQVARHVAFPHLSHQELSDHLTVLLRGISAVVEINGT